MRLALALTVLPALPAAAAVEPCHLDRMVTEAVRVIQIMDQKVGEPDEIGDCTLTGTVARSFRGDIAPGTLVQTTFACAEPSRVVDGEMVFYVDGPVIHDPEEVARAGAIELHTAPEGGPAGVGWGLLPLEAPTDRPAFRFEYLREGC